MRQFSTVKIFQLSFKRKMVRLENEPPLAVHRKSAWALLTHPFTFQTIFHICSKLVKQNFMQNLICINLNTIHSLCVCFFLTTTPQQASHIFPTLKN